MPLAEDLALSATQARMMRKTSLETWSSDELKQIAEEEARSLIERCSHGGRLNGVELMAAFGLAGVVVIDALAKHGLAAPSFIVDMLAVSMKSNFEARESRRVGRPRKETSNDSRA